MDCLCCLFWFLLLGLMFEPGNTYTWENKLHIRFIYLTSNKYAKISLQEKHINKSIIDYEVLRDFRHSAYIYI